MSNIGIRALCQSVKDRWPASLGNEGWHLALISTLITCNKIDEVGEVFKEIFETSNTSPAHRTHLSERFKDLIMKQWTLVGIPLAISAAFQLAKAEKEVGIAIPTREEQVQKSYYRGHESLPALEQQGQTAMRAIYQSNLDPIMDMWGAHRIDFQWLEERVIYGLFLSDYRYFSPQETSVVNIGSIMPQGLNSPTMWHIRGIRRLGVGLDDAETVCDIVKMVAKWAGKDTSLWLNAKDVDVS